jgi:beta-mannosidase
LQIRELALSDLIQKHGAANLLVWISFKTGGQIVSENLATFAKPKELALLDPGLVSAVSGKGKQWTVTLTAKHPALWTWLEVAGAEARYSDNFIHVSPAKPASIGVTLEKELSKEEFVRSLKTRSLHDTFKVEEVSQAR